MGLSSSGNPKPSIIHHTAPQRHEQQHFIPIRSPPPHLNNNYVKAHEYRQTTQPNFAFNMNSQHRENSFPTPSHSPKPASFNGPQIYETTIPPSSLTSYSTTVPYQPFVFNNPSNTQLRPVLQAVPSVVPTVPLPYHRHSSTTPRNAVPYSNQQRYPGPIFEFKIAKAPQLESNSLHHPEANNIVSIRQNFGKDNHVDAYYHDPDAYSTNEYERIPMEFINELRPILISDEIIQTTPSTSTIRSNNNVHSSKKVYQPVAFFDNFFKPFNNAHGISTNLAPHVTPHKNGRITNSIDVQESSSNSQIVIKKPPAKFTSSTTSTSTFNPSQQIYSLPDHSMEFGKAETQLPKLWNSDNSDTLSFTSSDAKSQEGRTKSSENIQKEDIKLKGGMSKYSQFKMHSLNQSKAESTTSSYANPSPLLDVIPTSTNSISDDLKEESNTPNSISTTDRTNVRKIVRTRTSSVSEKSRKVVRRPIKIPVDRNRILSSRGKHAVENKEESSELSVTTHRPRRMFTTSTSTDQFKSTTGKPKEFDSFRGRPKRRRVIFRKPIAQLGVDSSETKELENTSSLPPEDVTYGESQWFQVSSSTEDYTNNSRIRHGTNKNGKMTKSFSSLPLATSTVPSFRDESLESSSEGLIESQHSSPQNVSDANESEGKLENLSKDFESTKTD